MNNIKLYVHLPSKIPYTIRVNGDDTVNSWVASLLKEEAMDSHIGLYSISKNKTVAVSTEKTFYESGFKPEDQLHIAYKRTAPESVRPVEPDNIPVTENKNADSTPSVTKPPEPSETINTNPTPETPPSNPVGKFTNTGYNTKISRQQKPVIENKVSPPPESKNYIYYIVFIVIILAICMTYFLLSRPGSDNEKTMIQTARPALTVMPPDKSDVTPRGDHNAENKNRAARMHSESGKANEPAHTAILHKPIPPPSIITGLSVSGYFSKLIDDRIPYKKKMAYKAGLLDCFISPNAPVIKMNNGHPTNTRTTIRDYTESVILLGTHVNVVSEEHSGNKISKINVSEK